MQDFAQEQTAQQTGKNRKIAVWTEGQTATGNAIAVWRRTGSTGAKVLSGTAKIFSEGHTAGRSVRYMSGSSLSNRCTGTVFSVGNYRIRTYADTGFRYADTAYPDGSLSKKKYAYFIRPDPDPVGANPGIRG